MPSVARPASLDEALDALRAGPGVRPIAGGVGLLLRAALGESLPDRVVAVGRLPELRSIEPAGDGLRVGASVSLAELARSALVRERAPLLAEAAGAAANPGVRTTATFGGNLIDRPGGSDLVAAALALDARAIWAGVRAEPSVRPLGRLEAVEADAASGRRSLLVAILIGRRHRAWGFERLTTRGAGDRPAATVAVTLPDENEGEHESSVARGWATFVADTPISLSRSAQAVFDGASVEATRRAVEDDLAGVAVADDLRATAAYRRRVLPVLLSRAVAAARDRR